MEDSPIRIAFCGKMGAGKDHLGDWALAEFGLEKLSFSALLKALWVPIREIAGFPEEKSFARPYLQQMGSAARALDEDVLVRTALSKVKPGKGYVLTDLRFPSEVKRLREAGFFIVRVECPEDVRIARLQSRDGGYTEATGQDATELAISDIVPDMEVSGLSGDTASTRHRLRAVCELLKEGYAPNHVMGVIESIERGIKDAAEGRVYTWEEVQRN